MKRLPGQTVGWRWGRGEGEMVVGRGTEEERRNSPAWWVQSPAMRMKVEGEAVVLRVREFSMASDKGRRLGTTTTHRICLG